jgi:hypothetical protein
MQPQLRSRKLYNQQEFMRDQILIHKRTRHEAALRWAEAERDGEVTRISNMDKRTAYDYGCLLFDDVMRRLKKKRLLP